MTRAPRTLGVVVSSLLFLHALGAAAHAQCLPHWTPEFSDPGANGSVRALAFHDDGSGEALYAGGDFTSVSSAVASHVARYEDGAWTALGAGIGGKVFALCGFDAGGGPRLYAGGDFTSAGGGPAVSIASWDGAAWSPVGSGTNGRIQALAVFDDGSGPALYAGGFFSLAGGVGANHVARWDGQAWSALGSGIDTAPFHRVQALVVHDDGGGPALYVGGSFASAGGVLAANLARWDGAAWSAVGGGLNSEVYTLAVHDEGNGPALYVGGYFTSAGGVAASRVARWNGATWSAVGSGLSSGGVLGLGAHDDGGGPALYATGTFSSAGPTQVARIARWDGAAWTPLGSGLAGAAIDLSGGAVIASSAGTGLIVGGGFEQAGGVAAWHVARWSAASWSALGGGAAIGGAEGFGDGVYASTVFDDGSGPALYAGGRFMTAGDVDAPQIARWDGTAWSALGAGITGVPATVNCLGVYDDGNGPALYAGGIFYFAGGILAENIARWDGTAWSTVGSVASDDVFALAVYGDPSTGLELYAGGHFFNVGGQTEQRIARWNGSAWNSVGGGLSGTDSHVRALVVYDDGTGPALYAGGLFAQAGGAPARNVARWDGTSWSPLGIPPADGVDGQVEALTVHDDGSGPALYVGGGFASAGGAPAARIARWDGTSWSALGSGASAGVSALASFDDGTGSGPALYAAGSFTSIGGVGARRIARWDGSAWSPLGDGIRPVVGQTAQVRTLQSFDQPSPSLYAGGRFGFAGEYSARHLARWEGCVEVGHALCSGDGSTATACPCANTGASGRGCANSAAGSTGARLAASGTIAPDALVLHASEMLATSTSLFLQGDAGAPGGIVFGDGVRCAAGGLLRIGVESASAGASSYPGAGEPSVSARSAALGDVLAPGSIRFYQTWYRDPDLAFCPAPQGNAWNATNALRIVW